MVPAHARKRHPIVEQRMRDIAAWAEKCAAQPHRVARPRVGIITGGVAYQYAREVFPNASVLKLGMVYPLPSQLIRTFAAGVERLVVIEELDPFIEEQVRLLGIAVRGQVDLPALRRARPDRRARRRRRRPACRSTTPPVRVPAVPRSRELPARPPVLCPGCPHRGVFQLLAKKKRAGHRRHRLLHAGRCCRRCRRIHTCGCMGAGIGVAHGAAKAGIGERMVAVIGDSTFFHTGLPALANVAYNKANILTIILDNRTTAMTGHQPNPGTGVTLQQQPADAIELEPLVRALGIQHVATVDAYDVDEVEKAYKELMAHQRARGARSRGAPAPCCPRSASSGCRSRCSRRSAPAAASASASAARPSSRARRWTRRPASPWRSSTPACAPAARSAPRSAPTTPSSTRDQMRLAEEEQPRRLHPADPGEELSHGRPHRTTSCWSASAARARCSPATSWPRSAWRPASTPRSPRCTAWRSAAAACSPTCAGTAEHVFSPLVGARRGRRSALLREDGGAALRRAPAQGRHRGRQRHGGRAGDGLLRQGRVPGRRAPRAASSPLSTRDLIMVPGEKLAQEAGTVKAANVVLLGAISKLLPLPEDVWWQCLSQRVPPRSSSRSTTRRSPSGAPPRLTRKQ